MQAVILAAGQSSRLYPIANGVHKSMISLLGKPILAHTILGLKESGITDMLLVVDKNPVIQSYFGDGKRFGVSLTYVTQNEPLGMGNALLSAKSSITGDFVLLHPHHIDVAKHANDLLEKKGKSDGILLVEEREETWKYGVLKVVDEKIVDIIEKPQKGEEPSHLCLVGMYVLNKNFLEILGTTPTEHYQFEKALAAFARDHDVKFVETKKQTVTLKYPWDLLTVKDYLLVSIKTSIAKEAKIAESAEIIGNVVIERGATIMEGVKIKGPAYIGKDAYIGTNAILRNGIDVEAGGVIGANMEIKNSILLKGSTTHSGFIGDSIIGEKCKIAANFVTANVRIDRKPVEVTTKKGKVSSNRKSLGIIMGNNVNVGIGVSTMPGVVIGNSVTIGPSTTVGKNIQDDVKYYTKFQEIVEVKTPENKDTKKQKIVLFDIDYTLFDTDEFKRTNLTKYSLYEEVQEVLGQLGKDVLLGIFSEGDTLSQETKLLQTAIDKHFSKEYVHIVTKKNETLRDVFAKYQSHTVIFVDDKLPILYEAKIMFPSVFTVWIKRGIYANKQGAIEGFVPDAIITTLREVIPVVSSL